ncbi:hypothetical protein OSTOST_16924 [Ostertagia ostertagi]
MGRKRAFDSASCSRDVDEELSQPSVKMPRPLRRSQSLRARAGVVELAYQLAELNAEQAPDQDTGSRRDPMVDELERPGSEPTEDVEELLTKSKKNMWSMSRARQGFLIRIRRSNSRLSMVPLLKLHFGVSEKMASFLDDYLALLAAPVGAQFLSRIPPKRCKAMKRTVIHFLEIEPQLSLILNNVLPTLVQLHREIHSGEASSKRCETTSFPRYKRSIETLTEFDERKIKIILTLNFDGVKLKKLSRSEAWPIYIRLEGLPFKEKNKIENVVLAGITFTRKLPRKSFYRNVWAVS